MELGILTDLVGIVPSLAITAVFVWYELKRQAQWQLERQEMNRQFMQFLTEQRTATLATLDVVAMRLQQIGDLVLGVDACAKRIEQVFTHHDDRAENIAITIEGMRSKLNGSKPVEKDKVA